MDQERISVSYRQAGYESAQDEAEAHHEARERLRRRILSIIRGLLREDPWLRWWVGSLLLECAASAWLLAWCLQNTRWPGSLWFPGLAVGATWPVFVFRMKRRADREAQRIKLSGDWRAQMTRDQYGETQDRLTTEYIDSTLNKAWDANRYSCQNQLLGAALLSILSLGTWLVWDLLRMAPSVLAEIILDGVIIQDHPELKKQLPYYTWSQNAFLATALHFVGAAVMAILLAGLWRVIPFHHKEGSGAYRRASTNGARRGQLLKLTEAAPPFLRGGLVKPSCNVLQSPKTVILNTSYQVPRVAPYSHDAKTTSEI